MLPFRRVKQHERARICVCCNSQSIAVHLSRGKTGVARVVLATKQEEKWAEDTSITGQLIRELSMTADVLRSNATFEVLGGMMGS